jgi:hypothetical protein
MMGLVALVLMLMVMAPATAASLGWRLLPSFESSEILPGILLIGGGMAYQSGDDWPLECMKQRCPTESFFCLLDRDCRSFVAALYVGVEGTGGGLCSRDLALEAACGTTCSRATLAFRSCLESPAGSQCAYSTDALPVVVHRNALDEPSLALIEEIAREEMHTPGNHVHRSFGSDGDGNSTTGHVVTWLTPAIHRREGLVRRLRELASESVAAGGWRIRDLGSLTVRCAELLEYGDANSTGLGWHWDVGSTITMLTMLHPASDGSGELQLSTNCTVHRVPLQRGDMAVYRSRHRHRVTTVTSPRRVLAVELWRSERTDRPHRPGAAATLLQEPPLVAESKKDNDQRQVDSQHGAAAAAGTPRDEPDAGYEVEL